MSSSRKESIDDLSQNNSESESEFEYHFNTPVNKRLSEILEIPPLEIISDEIWNPPEEYGLNNCNYIIPNYYKRPKQGILDIEYYTIIIDDIRNLRPLNKYQLEYIMKLDDYYKNEIITLLNNSMKSIVDLIDFPNNPL
jgi:hypothetical protein